MEGIISLLAVGIVSCLILFLAQIWDVERHRFYKILASGFFIAIILLVPKVALDFNDHCDFVVNQSIVSAGSTTYTYDYLCASKTETSNSTLYTTTLWFMRTTFLYAAVFGIWLLFNIWKQKRAKDKQKSR